MPTKRGLTFDSNRGETSIQPTLASACIHIGENSSSYIDYNLVYKFADGPSYLSAVQELLTCEEKQYLQEQPTVKLPGTGKLHYKVASEDPDFNDLKVTWVVGNIPHKGELKEVHGQFGRIGFEVEKEVEYNQPPQLVVINAKKHLFCTSLGPIVKPIGDYVVKKSNGEKTNVEAPSEDEGHFIRFEVSFYVDFFRDCLLEFESVYTFKKWIKNNLRMEFAQYNGIKPHVELRHTNGKETPSQPFQSLKVDSCDKSNDDSTSREKEIIYPAVFELRFDVPAMELKISELQKDSSEKKQTIQKYSLNPLSINVELNNENELLITTYQVKFYVNPGSNHLKKLRKDKRSLMAEFYHRVDEQKLFKNEVEYEYEGGKRLKGHLTGGQYISFGKSQFVKIGLGDVVTDERVMDTIVLKLSYISSLKLSLRNNGWDQVRNENAEQFWFHHCLNGLETTKGINSLKSLYTFNHSTDSSSVFSDYFYRKDYRCFLVKEGSNSGLLYQYVLLQFNSEFVRQENRQRVFKYDPEVKNCIEIHLIFENTDDMKAVVKREIDGKEDEINLFYGPEIDKNLSRAEIKEFETNRLRPSGGKRNWYYNTVDKTVENCLKSCIGIDEDMFENGGYKFRLHANKSFPLCEDSYDLSDQLENFGELLKTDGNQEKNYAYDSKFTKQVLSGILTKFNSRKLNENSRREIIIISRPHEFVKTVEALNNRSNNQIRIQHLFIGLGVKNHDAISKDYGSNDVKCISHGDLYRRLQRVMQIAVDPTQREFLKVRKFSGIKQHLDKDTMSCSLQSPGSMYWSKEGSSKVDAYERKLLYAWVSKQKITLPINGYSKIKLELTCQLENQKFKNAEPFSAKVPIDFQANIITIDSTNREQHHYYLECLRKIDQEKLLDLDQENLLEESNKSVNQNSNHNYQSVGRKCGRQQSTKNFCEKNPRLSGLKNYITLAGNVRANAVPDELLETIPSFRKYKNQLEKHDAVTLAFRDYFKELYEHKLQQGSQSSSENLNDYAVLLHRMERKIASSES